jgi:hypothetical protein
MSWRKARERFAALLGYVPRSPVSGTAKRIHEGLARLRELTHHNETEPPPCAVALNQLAAIACQLEELQATYSRRVLAK